MTYSIEANYIKFFYPEGGGYQRINSDFIDLVANPALTKRMNVLIDLRSLPTQPKSEDMKKIADRFNTLSKNLGPKASFLVKNKIEFGMIRIFGAYAETHGLEINIFKSEEKAISWLLE